MLVFLVMVALVLAGVVRRPVPPASAAVVRVGGFAATVAGHSGWFGSYDLAGIGTVWCVDHGIAAPDAAFRYVPTGLAQASPPTRTAMAWALGRHGHRPDRVTAAALTLVMHDLMGATYPSGRLDVDRLEPGQLSGFEAREGDVLARARAIKADALAHAHLRGPLSLSAAVEGAGPLKAGRPGVLVARLTDAAGAGVAGVALSATATVASLVPGPGAVTDRNGEQRFAFVAGRGVNRFSVAGTAPDLRLQSFAPSARPAQRVARPGRVPVAAGLTVKSVTHKLSVRKTGDAAAYLPLAGARFEVRPLGNGSSNEPVGELVTGKQGASSALELDPGRYRVTEVKPPEGYGPAGPWTADLTSADVVLQVPNAAIPGTGRIAKVDTTTGKPVAGATLALAYDADHDGAFETPMGRWVSANEPLSRELRPGDYEVREVAAPPGYQLSDRPVRVSVLPGRVADASIANTPLPAPPVAARPPGTTLVTAQQSAPPLRRTVASQPAVARLAETGRPLLLLAGAGSGLLAGGSLLAVLGHWLVRPVRRRARSLGR